MAISLLFRFGDDWISIHEVVNSLPPVTIAPKLLKATFTQDLEYKYCVEEVAESDPIELLIDKTQKGPSYPSLPLELFQDQEPDKRSMPLPVIIRFRRGLSSFTRSQVTQPGGPVSPVKMYGHA